MRTAVVNRRPVAAVYHRRPRLLCPHRLGWNQKGRPQVLCYQYGGGRERGLKPSGAPENWRCLAVGKLRGGKLLEGAGRGAPNPKRPQTCIVVGDAEGEGYPGRDVRGAARGWKAGGGSGADNLTLPTRAEGEKRVRSAIRNP